MSERLRAAYARRLQREANESAILFMVAVASLICLAAGLVEIAGVIQ